MDPESQVRRADRARRLLEDELVKEAREQIERTLWETFKASPLRDVEGREKLRLMQDVADKFFGYLAAVVQDGELAKLDIESKKKGLWKIM